jgi:hypothetical protein
MKFGMRLAIQFVVSERRDAGDVTLPPSSEELLPAVTPRCYSTPSSSKELCVWKNVLFPGEPDEICTREEPDDLIATWRIFRYLAYLSLHCKTQGLQRHFQQGKALNKRQDY